MHRVIENSISKEAPVTVEVFRDFTMELQAHLPPMSFVFQAETDLSQAISFFVSVSPIVKLLTRVSKGDVFSANVAHDFSNTSEELSLLRSYKLLKYSLSLPCGQLCNILTGVAAHFLQDYAVLLQKFSDRVLGDVKYGSMLLKNVVTAKGFPVAVQKLYSENIEYLLEHDPHAIFPTSIYRQSFGHVTSSKDSRVIEGVMGTTVTTTIEIVRDVLNPERNHLRDIYKPLRRCVCLVDERLDGLYGDDLNNYFASHSIQFEKLVYSCMEVDKDISTVEEILADLKERRVSRNEPVLVVGGGVMADIGGFACALYHRNTPYVMLCTSVVSGIDAGPSPRTCCDGLGYKNVFGAYHPPILTLTDRQFFKTLHPGWVRHGIAEIIKMAVTKDITLFDCVERAGNRLVETKFGVENCEPGSEIDVLSETIIAKAMDNYVQAEYGNLWETHQCRPHAYGHTWTPGFELQAGLLHGHAVAIGMGYGAYLSLLEGWLEECEFHRIMKVMSTIGLSLRHGVLDNPDLLWSSQVKMTEKRGGNLCAPVPRNGIGKCGYINSISRARLERTLFEYQQIVRGYPREGRGIEPHCADVGLEDPSVVRQHPAHRVSKGQISSGTFTGPASVPRNPKSNIDSYQAWVELQKADPNRAGTSSSQGSKISVKVPKDTPTAPQYDHSALFYPKAEDYARDMTSLPSQDFVMISDDTGKAGLYAACMVGQIEGQFLKMLTQIKNASRVLDIGTFTGYSALAFAEGLGNDGEVLTIEADKKTANIARSCFAKAQHGHKITLIEGDAMEEVNHLLGRRERFDIVFLDADKTNYRHYYEAGLALLAVDGILIADNALCSLLYLQDDPAAQSLHEFVQFVRSDERVEQVMLTIREGILMVRKR